MEFLVAWLSVKENPPTREDEPYLFFSNTHGRKFGAKIPYVDGVFMAWHEMDRDGSMDAYDDVSHWMPLPPPPNKQ